MSKADKRLFRMALVYAIQDRLDFIDAYKKSPNDPYRLAAVEQLQQFEDRLAKLDSDARAKR